MSQPKVSVIIPVYNAEEYLERCISSLQAQTLREIEMIFVDDASPDHSPEILDAAAKGDERIKVIHKANAGAGYARNSALEIAQGEYIGFVDADDFVDERMFEVLYAKAKEYSSDLVMSGVVFVDGNMFSENGEVEIKRYFEKDTHFETVEELNRLKMGIVGAPVDCPDDSRYSMSIWKNLFSHKVIKENALRFSSEREILSEDALFMIDFVSKIKKATGIPDAFYSYCRNAESISKGYKKDRFEKSLVFVSEVEKRFSADIKKEEYSIYLYRFWQAMCRVIASQEIMHASINGIPFSALKERLKLILSHPFTREVLSGYPISRLPLKQRIFAYAMKFRAYFILKLLVTMRSR